MDNLALLWIMGTFLYVFHPPPTEIGVYAGPTWPEDIHRDQEDARLVAGGGIAVQATERVSVAVEFRYGVNLRELDSFQADDSNGTGTAATLIAGVNYHLNR